MTENENAVIHDGAYEFDNDIEGSPSLFFKIATSYKRLKTWAKIAVPAFIALIIVAIIVLLFSVFHSDVKLNARISDLYEDDRILPTYQQFSEHYESFLVEQVGLNEEQASEVIRGNENWRFFTLKIEFTNSHKYPIEIYRLNIVDNGKNGIWINPIFNGIFGIEPELDEAQKYNVEVIVGDPSLDLMDILRLAGELEATVEYTRQAAYDENGELFGPTDEGSMEQPPTMFAELKDAK